MRRTPCSFLRVHSLGADIIVPAVMHHTSGWWFGCLGIGSVCLGTGTTIQSSGRILTQGFAGPIAVLDPPQGLLEALTPYWRMRITAPPCPPCCPPRSFRGIPPLWCGLLVHLFANVKIRILSIVTLCALYLVEGVLLSALDSALVKRRAPKRRVLSQHFLKKEMHMAYICSGRLCPVCSVSVL